MIAARPSRWLKAWFGRVVAGRVRATFGALRVRGLDELQALVALQPVLFVSNHTSWWDPMFLIYLSTRLVPLDGYALMDARNLRRRAFLGRLGGFGVDLDDPADRSAGLAYTAGLLDRPRRGVWIFPQGRERPCDERPLDFKPGAAVVAGRAPGCAVVPVAFRYEFGSRERPEMLVSIGRPLPRVDDVSAAVAAQEQAVLAELEQIAAFVASRTGSTARGADGGSPHGFAAVLERREPWLGRLLERLLAWLTR
ncbi:MAG: lysophospholipid acyltransferase family protein [Deltaproteobacteria bacterium]|nr:lysophospholipid acyltransferase family protein [Deltaproteobacteria bacterium]